MLTNRFPGSDCDHIVRHYAHRSMLALRGVRTYRGPGHGHGRGSDSDCAGGGNLAGSWKKKKGGGGMEMFSNLFQARTSSRPNDMCLYPLSFVDLAYFLAPHCVCGAVSPFLR